MNTIMIKTGNQNLLLDSNIKTKNMTLSLHSLSLIVLSAVAVQGHVLFDCFNYYVYFALNLYHKLVHV